MGFQLETPGIGTLFLLYFWEAFPIIIALILLLLAVRVLFKKLDTMLEVERDKNKKLERIIQLLEKE